MPGANAGQGRDQRSTRRSCSSATASSRRDYKRDDYKGVDVRGKIVAYLGGAPERLSTARSARIFASAGTKAAIAAAHGAVGAIQLESPRVGRGAAVRRSCAHCDRAAR